MRSVLLGLVLAGLATAASAAGCPLTRATLEAVDSGEHYADLPVGRPDLVGQRFTVRRYTALKRMTRDPGTGSLKNTGYEAAELAGAAGRVVVSDDHVIGSPPIVTTSWLDDPARDAERVWNGARAPLVAIGSTPFSIIDGTLQSLDLKVVACR